MIVRSADLELEAVETALLRGGYVHCAFKSSSFLKMPIVNKSSRTFLKALLYPNELFHLLSHLPLQFLARARHGRNPSLDDGNGERHTLAIQDYSPKAEEAELLKTQSRKLNSTSNVKKTGSTLIISFGPSTQEGGFPSGEEVKVPT